MLSEAKIQTFTIPKVSSTPPLAIRQFMNPNPQAPFPLEGIQAEVDIGSGLAVFEADLSPAFIQAQIVPRGRPHFSLVHAGFVDDGIASAAFTLVTDEAYGQRWRYIENTACIAFECEAFIRDVAPKVPRAAVAVDGFQVRWQCLPIRAGVSLLKRGLLRVQVLGITSVKDEIPVARIEVEYLRRRIG